VVTDFLKDFSPLSSMVLCEQHKTSSYYNMVMMMIQVFSSDIQTQPKRDFEMCAWFSMKFDELTDISNTAAGNYGEDGI
jgi:hypothetical protein